MDKRRKCEIAIRVEVHRLDAIARCRNEPFELPARAALDRGTRPRQQISGDPVAVFARYSGRRDVARLLDPGGDFAIGGVDN